MQSISVPESNPGLTYDSAARTSPAAPFIGTAREAMFDQLPPANAYHADPKRGADRKVLLITQDSLAPFSSPLWQEANELIANGYTVSIICPVSRGFAARYEHVNGIHIFRHPLAIQTDGIFGAALESMTALFWQFSLSWKVLFKQGFDLIHASNSPDTSFLIAGFYKMFGGKQFLFEQRVLGPERYEARTEQRGFFYKILRLCERLSFALADVAVAANNSTRQIAVERGKMNPDKVFVVRSGPSLERMKIIPPVPALKMGKKFLVGYVGVMGQQEGIPYLIDAADHIINKLGRTDVHFTLVGGGPALDDMKKIVAAKGLTDSVTFTGHVPDQELLEVLNTSDVCVNPDEVNPMNDKSTMNKIMEYMALGKPIVQFDVTEGKFSAGDASLYAKPNDAVDLASKIVSLLDDPTKCAVMGALGRQRVENELAWPYQAPKLLKAYDVAFGPRNYHEKD